MLRALLTLVFVSTIFLSMATPADSIEVEPGEKASLLKHFNRQADSLDRELTFSTGQLSLAGGRIQLTVPDGFLFVDSAQTRCILETLWGNSPDREVCGMLVKKGFRASKLINDYSFVISFGSIGYVAGKDNADLHHAELLETIRHNMAVTNKNRVALGVNTMQVTGWALVPFFDTYKKALYWANTIRVSGSEEEVLNYNLIILGRSGVIKINAVATMDQFPAIKHVLPLIIAQTRFEPGQQYANYDKETDTLSTWTLPELITGKDRETETPNALLTKAGWLLLLLVLAGSFAGYSLKKRKQARSPSLQ